MSGLLGATAMAPIEAIGSESKIGFQVAPASIVFHTPAGRRAEIEDVRLARHAGHGDRPTAPIGPDAPPLEGAERRGRNLGGKGRS